MAELGLVPFARLALEIATAVLPRYRTRFSKHQFTQPQLLAVLCLMRHKDWTFREAEMRLSEHGELRQALGLHRVPDHTTMCRFLCRLPGEGDCGWKPTAPEAPLLGGVRSRVRHRRASRCQRASTQVYSRITMRQGICPSSGKKRCLSS